MRVAPLALGLGVLAWATAEGAPPEPPVLKLPPPAGPVGPATQTRCAPCHSVAKWSEVKFNHERTGFPLRGAHAATSCRSCHTKDFTRPVADRCSGCHRDVHAGEFGLRCEGCHEEKTWRSNFTADAHRRTNFPLTGGHALIPCQECHGQVRDRSFARAPLACMACHQADYQRAALTSIDHTAAGFGTECRQCHDSFRFTPARFSAHDRCFAISVGSHAGIRCTSCHTSTAGLQVSGACATGNAACSSCHTHVCARSDAEHQNVPGYQCQDQKCYECHRVGSNLLPRLRGGRRR